MVVFFCCHLKTSWLFSSWMLSLCAIFSLLQFHCFDAVLMDSLWWSTVCDGEHNTQCRPFRKKRFFEVSLFGVYCTQLLYIQFNANRSVFEVFFTLFVYIVLHFIVVSCIFFRLLILLHIIVSFVILNMFSVCFKCLKQFHSSYTIYIYHKMMHRTKQKQYKSFRNYNTATIAAAKNSNCKQHIQSIIMANVFFKRYLNVPWIICFLPSRALYSLHKCTIKIIFNFGVVALSAFL